MADADPLDGPRLRYERAREHLAHIKAEVEAIYEGFARVAAGEHPETRRYTVVFPELQQPPPTLSVRVGEMIYNLRACLDYVVFEFARHDSGERQEGTQFPIEDEEEFFLKTRRPTYLKGISDEHVALIEEYQPYKGCNWTGLLRGLSNPDKHRELHLLLAQLDDNIEIATGHSGTREDLDRINQFGPETEVQGLSFWVGRSRHVDVQLQLTASVTLPEGRPVVETLEDLQVETETLVQRFRAVFR